MTAYAKEELNLVAQGIIGLILALLIIVLLFQVVPNFNTFAITSIALGSVLLYSTLSKNRNFMPVILTFSVMSIAFSFIY